MPDRYRRIPWVLITLLSYDIQTLPHLTYRPFFLFVENGINRFSASLVTVFTRLTRRMRSISLDLPICSLN